jgi:hypothetical protein
LRIGYLISAYKNPRHLARLIRRLHTGSDTEFLVHVDRKTDDATFRSMVEGVADLDGIGFLQRHTCHWGGFGHVRASLKGIRAFATGDFDPDYVILLSGQDYPIKTNEYLQRFLAQGEGRSFFMYFSLPTPNWANGGLDRFRDWHLRYDKIHVRLPLRRSPPGALEPWGGSAYWIVSRQALQTMHEFVETNPRYVRFFKHVDIPDELFFQTILLNSAQADRCVNFRLHYTEWTRTPAPAILTRDDYDRLAESTCLFARKFDAAVDEEILDMVDDGLLR